MVEHFGLCAGNLNCTGSRNFQIAPVGNYAACVGIKMTSKKTSLILPPLKMHMFKINGVVCKFKMFGCRHSVIHISFKMVKHLIEENF